MTLASRQITPLVRNTCPRWLTRKPVEGQVRIALNQVQVFRDGEWVKRVS